MKGLAPSRCNSLNPMFDTLSNVTPVRLAGPTDPERAFRIDTEWSDAIRMHRHEGEFAMSKIESRRRMMFGVLSALVSGLALSATAFAADDVKPAACCKDGKCCGEKACTGDCCKSGKCTHDCCKKAESAACCKDGKCCGEKACTGDCCKSGKCTHDCCKKAEGAACCKDGKCCGEKACTGDCCKSGKCTHDCCKKKAA